MWLIGCLPEPVKSAVPGLSKGDIDGDVDQVKMQVKVLIESQLKEMQSREVIMKLCLRWKRPVKSAVTLEP